MKDIKGFGYWEVDRELIQGSKRHFNFDSVTLGQDVATSDVNVAAASEHFSTQIVIRW